MKMKLFKHSRSETFPPQAKYIIGNEACERFSFYGMRSLLAGYMTSCLLLSDDTATEAVHWFVAANYLMPLLGGWIADRWWGRYKTILLISLFYCLGHAVLACSDLFIGLEEKQLILWIGLALIAFGSGGIKPCVSSFMGDQFPKDASAAIRKAYAAFYWAINLGSLLAFIIIPWVKDHHGYSWAFGIPGIFMALATFIFWSGRHKYVYVSAVGKTERHGVISVLFFSVIHRMRLETMRERCKELFSSDEIDDASQVLKLIKIFLLTIPFWAAFDQTASTWVLQGVKMEPWLLSWGGGTIQISAEQMQSANPVFVLILIPILTRYVYPRSSWLNNPLRRMSLGMFIAGGAYVIVAGLQYFLSQGESLSLAWQVLPYFILTIAEVFVSTTGLEFAFTQAPARLKSSIMSYWNLSLCLGNLLVVLITAVGGSEGSHNSVSSSRFLIYSVLVFIVASCFAWVSMHYKSNVSEKE